MINIDLNKFIINWLQRFSSQHAQFCMHMRAQTFRKMFYNVSIISTPCKQNKKCFPQYNKFTAEI